MKHTWLKAGNHSGNKLRTYNCFNYTLTSRPEYGYLVNIKLYFPNIPVMALTATATPALQNELLASLRDPVVQISSINKPNISLHAFQLTNLPKNGMS